MLKATFLVTICWVSPPARQQEKLHERALGIIGKAVALESELNDFERAMAAGGLHFTKAMLAPALAFGFGFGLGLASA